MLAYVGRMQLGDGSMSRLNGAGRSMADAVATVMIFHDPSDASPRWGGLGGYARLKQAGTIVVVDAGSAPPLTTPAPRMRVVWRSRSALVITPCFRNCGAPARNLAEHRALPRDHEPQYVGDCRTIVGDAGALPQHRAAHRGLPLTGPSQVVATVEESAEGQRLRASTTAMRVSLPTQTQHNALA